MLADDRFLAETHHAFLIRRPEEIVASYYALWPDMRFGKVGLETLHELHAAVSNVGGHEPVVIDADDLVTRPAATVAAYRAAVDLPFISEALTWEPGDRPEWSRSAHWQSTSEPAPVSQTVVANRHARDGYSNTSHPGVATQSGCAGVTWIRPGADGGVVQERYSQRQPGTAAGLDVKPPVYNVFMTLIEQSIEMASDTSVGEAEPGPSGVDVCSTGLCFPCR